MKVLTIALLTGLSLMCSSQVIAAEPHPAPAPKAIHTYSDNFNRPIEVKADWYFKGHRSRSIAEKKQLAEDALKAKGKELVQKLNQQGVHVKFVDTTYVRIDNGWSKTKKNTWGKRSHKCGGIAVGYLLYTF